MTGGAGLVRLAGVLVGVLVQLLAGLGNLLS
jgi:hypothetical protein